MKEGLCFCSSDVWSMIHYGERKGTPRPNTRVKWGRMKTAALFLPHVPRCGSWLYWCMRQRQRDRERGLPPSDPTFLLLSWCGVSGPHQDPLLRRNIHVLLNFCESFRESSHRLRSNHKKKSQNKQALTASYIFSCWIDSRVMSTCPPMPLKGWKKEWVVWAVSCFLLCSALQRGLGLHNETNAQSLASKSANFPLFFFSKTNNSRNLCREISLRHPLDYCLRWTTKAAMWALHCVYFFGFLCRHTEPSLRKSSYSAGWRRGGGGQDRPYWADLIPPEAPTMDELCRCINIYLSNPPPLPFLLRPPLIASSLWANQQQEEQGRASPPFVRVRRRRFRAADQRASWLTLTMHLVQEEPTLHSLFISGSRTTLPIFMRALLKLCIHEMQIGCPTPGPYIHTLRAAHSVLIYFDLAMWMASGCLRSSLFRARRPSCLVWPGHTLP